jgi:GNAT superfamily N-acetyltransferase
MAEVEHHDTHQAVTMLDALCLVYDDAYGVEPGTKTSGFRTRAEKAATMSGYDLVTATADSELVGFAFGYTLPKESRWWEGLSPDPGEDWRAENGTRTFVLSEIEVRRDWQGSGVGRLLHDALLRDRPEDRATLATSVDAAVQPVYAHWGWRKVGRVPGSTTDYYSAYDLFVLPLGKASSP